MLHMEKVIGTIKWEITLFNKTCGIFLNLLKIFLLKKGLTIGAT